jgi:hypothetical protein
MTGSKEVKTEYLLLIRRFVSTQKANPCFATAMSKAQADTEGKLFEP